MSNTRLPGAAAGLSRPALALATIAALSGCMDTGVASRAALAPGDPAGASVSEPRLNRKGAVSSSVIEDLVARNSVLPAGGPFAQVADAVIAAGAGTAESELRIKRLTAQARSKNWLPRIGPNVSLTSLGSVAASLLLDQALFDNGRRKAERAFAAADVEVAAVSLAVDLNARVQEGLLLYIEAERARDLAAISARALERMAEFDRIMRLRVEGGLSDGSELRIVAQKRSEMQAALATEQSGRDAALAELAALADVSLDGLSGLSSLPGDPGSPEPLAVLLARGEGARTLAEVDMARAGMKAGFGASAGLDADGGLDAGLSLDGEGLGFGRKASLQALAETEELARRKVAQAEDDSRRQITALERDIASLQSEQTQSGSLLAEMEANLPLYTEQYKAGRRTLIELVGQFESVVRMQRDHASVKYKIAAARVMIARERGVLVDGVRM